MEKVRTGEKTFKKFRLDLTQGRIQTKFMRASNGRGRDNRINDDIHDEIHKWRDNALVRSGKVDVAVQ